MIHSKYPRSFFQHLLVGTLVVTLLPGCTFWHKFRQKEHAVEQVKAAPKPKLVQSIGTIVLVNTEGGFVLIDNGTRPSPTMGTTAQSRSADGSAADLRITEIRKRPFAIADIIRGVPKKGDEVFQ
jgi:hypothetical protein